MIRPINDVQQVSSTTTTVSTPPPVIKTAVPETPKTVASATVQTSLATKSQAFKSTSISNLMQNNTPTSQQHVETKNEQNETAFGIEDLLHCWDEYAAKVPEQKGHLKNTMINCKPAPKDNFLFEIVVHNPVQKDELVNESADILQALRSKLKNNRIQLTVRIDEANEKKLAYTAQEKYEYLNEINGLLSYLRDEFDLTIN